MTTEMLPLDVWASTIYGEHRPCDVTLRRWARDGKIQPIPTKHGRAYFVHRSARYVAHGQMAAPPKLETPPLIARITANAPHPKREKASTTAKPLRT